MAGIRVIGSATQLLAYHGYVDYDKFVEAIAQSTELGTVNVKDINNFSMQGGIYVTDNGRICDTFDKADERCALYKIVPTGLTLKYSNKHLFASFIKIKEHWEGVYLSTAERLFTMYKEHYSGSDFCDQYLDVFCNGEDKQLIGFGLKDLLGIKEETQESGTEVTSDEARLNELNLAISNAERELKSSKKSKSNKNKIKSKLDKMKASRTQLIKKINKSNAASKTDANNNGTNEEESKSVVENDKISTEQAEEAVISDKRVCVDNSEKEDSQLVNSDVTHESIEITDSEKANEPETIEEEPVADEQTIANESIEQLESVDNNTTEETVVQMDDIDYTLDEEDINSLDISVDVPKSTSSTSITGHKLIDVGNKNPILNAANLKQIATLAEEIYGKLLIKEDWADNNFARLCFYIKSIVLYIEECKRRNRNIDGIVYSSNGSKALININLIDEYGNFIYIIDHSAKEYDLYKKVFTVMQSKTSLLDEGFELKSVKALPEALKFVESPSELVFCGNMDDFDLEDEEHLNHIINERRYRFPEKYKNTPCKNICDMVRTSIEQAIKISKIDYRYIVPMYNTKMLEVEFLIPLHLDTHYGQTQELAIIVTNKRGLWKIFTILPTADACEHARLISNVKDNWIS